MSPYLIDIRWHLGILAYKMKARFQGQFYDVVFTNHALEQMQLRGIASEEVIRVIEHGDVKQKKTKGKYWVFSNIKNRTDNFVCISISLEPPHLIVITTLVNWSPKWKYPMTKSLMHSLSFSNKVVFRKTMKLPRMYLPGLTDKESCLRFKSLMFLESKTLGWLSARQQSILMFPKELSYGGFKAEK